MISKDGDSALMLASRCGHTNVAMKLVEAGANLDLQDKVCVKLAIVMQSHILVKYIVFLRAGVIQPAYIITYSLWGC